MVVWIELGIHVVMIIGRRTNHPCWVRSGWSMLYFANFLVVAV